jgi:ArsR family transcriptional regulator
MIVLSKGGFVPSEMVFTPTQYEQAALIFKGFSHPIRIRIVEILKGRPLRTSDIANSTGYEITVVTKQLLYLRRSGIVVRTREGLSYQYSLSNPYFENIMKCMHHCLDM